MLNPQSYTITSGNLRVVFERRDDRWVHRVELIPADGEPTSLFASVEGTPASTAPPSPPVQELQMSGGTYAPALLGVGMACRNHWSLTCGVRRTPGSPVEGHAICLEVACRVKDDHPVLTSTYRANAGVQISALTEESMELSSAGDGVRIRTPDATASITNGGFAIHAREMPHKPPRTVRWSYSITPTSLTAAPES